MGATPAEQPGRYRLASPADHLPLGMRQLLVEGELGDLMKPYAAAARAAGGPIEELAPAGADHFDIVTPGLPDGAKIGDFIVTRAVAK